MKLQKQVRTVHEIDLETLNLHKVDGKNFSLPPYVEKDWGSVASLGALELESGLCVEKVVDLVTMTWAS